MHKVCPICHSDNVTGAMIMIMGQYKCLDCGYSGPFIMELDDQAYEDLLLDDENRKRDQGQ